MVRARGPAVREPRKSIVQYIIERMESRGDISEFIVRNDPADGTILAVPANADARQYPRAINGSPVKIARFPDDGPSVDGPG